jgi:hypothetical protein
MQATFTGSWITAFAKATAVNAVVTQLVECQPSKLNVASSNLVRRSPYRLPMFLTELWKTVFAVVAQG